MSILVGMAVFLKKSSGLIPYPESSTAGGHLDWPIFLTIGATAVNILLAFFLGAATNREATPPSSQTSSARPSMELGDEKTH